MENALDRLKKCDLPPEKIYTVEEQIESAVSTDDYLDGMSDEAKAKFNTLIEEVTPIEDPIEENVNEELFNSNTEPETVKRKYTKREKTEKPVTEPIIDSVLNASPILDQLSKNLIDELRANKYKLDTFDNNSMKIIFDYLYTKI